MKALIAYGPLWAALLMALGGIAAVPASPETAIRVATIGLIALPFALSWAAAEWVKHGP